MKKSKLMDIPLYVRDRQDGSFAQVIEQEGDDIFAYYIDLKAGRYSVGIGSITANLKDDLDCIEVLSEELCETLHNKLHLIRQRNTKAAFAARKIK